MLSLATATTTLHVHNAGCVVSENMAANLRSFYQFKVIKNILISADAA